MAEYIERETAKRALRRLEVIPKYTVDGRAVTDKIIDAIPAADVAPVVHGRWIKHGYVCGEYEWECSVCHETEWRGYSGAEIMKFCMFCGARMDGGADND